MSGFPFAGPDSFMMTEGRLILEWLGEEMKRRGVNRLDIPLPSPTPAMRAVSVAVERLATEAAAAPGRLLLDIFAQEGGVQ